MSRSLTAVLMAAALAAPAALVAQDAAALYAPVLGEWEMTLETPRGSFTQTFAFELDGDALTGTTSSQRGESDLTNVSFEDGTLKFDVTRNFRGNSNTQSYTAKIDGDRMEGTVSGGRGGDREFTASRKAT